MIYYADELVLILDTQYGAEGTFTFYHRRDVENPQSSYRWTLDRAQKKKTQSKVGWWAWEKNLRDIISKTTRAIWWIINHKSTIPPVSIFVCALEPERIYKLQYGKVGWSQNQRLKKYLKGNRKNALGFLLMKNACQG